MIISAIASILNAASISTTRNCTLIEACIDMPGTLDAQHMHDSQRPLARSHGTLLNGPVGRCNQLVELMISNLVTSKSRRGQDHDL